MKHNAFTALSLAAALVVAGSAEASEFSMNFESGTALPATEGTWTAPTGDASAVIATPSGAPAACQTQVLSLDTGDGELNYAPTSQNVTILEMDVCFVGADSAPDETGFNGQTMVYLNSTDNTLYAYVGNSWITLTNGIVDGSWHSLGMTFDYTAKTVDFSVDGHTVATDVSMGNDSSFQKVTSVGFKGTGMVDNFVGEAVATGIPAKVDDGQSTFSATDNGDGTITVDFGATTGIAFIRVYDETNNKWVTLRTSDPNATINVSKLAKVSYVQAVTSGTATTGVTPSASAVAVDTTTGNISITVPNAVSGLYYTPFGPDGKALANSKEILPEADGDPATLPPVSAAADWGVVKFQIVASDEKYTEGQSLQPNN